MKNVVVTGAASGIGKAVVKACISEGFHVIAADNDMDGLECLAAGVGREQLEVQFADFSDFSTIKSFIPGLYEKHNSLYALINNAGLYPGKSVCRYTDKELDDTWIVNLKALVYLSKDFAEREMESKAFRSIVNITSVEGEAGGGDARYGATKAGVIGLTKANAWNFAPYIRVNAVSPAMVRETAIHPLIANYRQQEYTRAETINGPTRSDSMADIIIFLLSEKSTQLTGKVVAVNDGTYPVYQQEARVG